MDEPSVIWNFTEIGKGTLTTNNHENDYDFIWAIDGDRHAPDRDFTKAGFHLEIPADKWLGTMFGNSSSHIWEQNTQILSTWYMHTGREGATIRTPERTMNQLRPVAMKQNVEKLLEDYCSFEDDQYEDEKTKTSLIEYIFH